MSADLAAGPVERYLAAVDAALADLPAAERADLLDDLREHLTDVAAETGGELQATLGSPAAYADELRSASGLAAAEPRPQSADWRGLAVRGARVAGAYLVTLRPGWWVLRGALLGLALVGPGRIASTLATPRGSDVAGLLLSATLGAVASVLLGRALLRTPAWTRSLLDVLALVLILVAGDQLQQRVSAAFTQAGAVYPAPAQTAPDSLTFVAPVPTDAVAIVAPADGTPRPVIQTLAPPEPSPTP